nr:hypothetical protein [Mesorhizobium sp. LSHC424B00]
MSLIAPAIAAIPVAAVMGMAAMPADVAAVSACDMRAISGSRQKQAPRYKTDHADKRQKQNCNLDPTGLSHSTSPLFPFSGRQCNSREWI